MYINIENLTFQHHAEKPLFNNLSLNINEGGICGLLGKNGAGKSTLLKIIAGLIKGEKGSCHVFNESSFLRDLSVLQQIFFVPENTDLPALNAQDFKNTFSTFYPNFNEKLFKNNLHDFSLSTHKKLNELSLGQQRKFTIAFALATCCKLIILDEPTNGLDIPSKQAFRKIILSSLQEQQLILISTHQVYDIQNIIDSLIFLDAGKIHFHQKIYAISDVLSMQKTWAEPQDKNVIYYEKRPEGYLTLKNQSAEHEETEIDLEFLFNAISEKHVEINQIISGEKNEKHT